MPKISVYVPDDLYQRARASGLAVSALTQEAIVEALRKQHNERWVAGVRRRPSRVEGAIDTSSLMAEVREEFGS
jgi:post-segregation antitoxin (ccd killing protein)